ncbi:HAD family hydrolase [Euzebya rosea]|uniref:HAD family hydrolase n=1 Tax=Euzebya rosea TaxID=2052804 RepID=UPI000D3E09FA|nr:HAD hydrolase family protein [Euzebya rosea]
MDLDAHLATLPPPAIVYTDLDGTLLGRNGSILADGEGRPTLDGVAALVRARQDGLLVVAVSGRRVADLRGDVRLLGLDGAIAEAGTVRLVDGDARIAWGACPTDIADTPRSALVETGALQLVLDCFPGRIRVYSPWDDGRLGGVLLHGRVDTTVANERLAAAGIGWARLLDNGSTGGWPDLDGVRAYHLIPRGVGKAASVAADLEDRGLVADRAVAVGDSEEDRTMAEVVGTYVTVANGHGSADGNRFLADRSHGAGVALVIDAALTARSRGR